jgi:hypothetical protein
VRELRAIFVMKSPLLADMISRVVARRLEDVGIRLTTEIVGDDVPVSALMLRARGSDVLFLSENRPPPAGLAALSVAVLTVSDDLSLVYGPEPSDVAPLTSEALAARLIAIAG